MEPDEERATYLTEVVVKVAQGVVIGAVMFFIVLIGYLILVTGQ